MDVEQILSSIRSSYINELVEELTHLQKDNFVALEPPHVVDTGEIATNGDLDLPTRVDYALLTEDDTETRSFQTPLSLYSFEPFDTNWINDVKISLYPFQWSECRCQIFDGPDEVDWDYIRQWYLKWFDEGLMDENGFSGCVHSMSGPEEIENGFEFLIDFGSAPVEAIYEWVETVKLAGFNKLQMGYINQVFEENRV